MDQLFTSINDLVKYKITSIVNTGDRTFDTLLVPILIILINMYFNRSIWLKLKSYLYLNGYFLTIKEENCVKTWTLQPKSCYDLDFVHRNLNILKQMYYCMCGSMTTAKDITQLGKVFGASVTQNTNYYFYMRRGVVAWIVLNKERFLKIYTDSDTFTAEMMFEILVKKYKLLEDKVSPKKDEEEEPYFPPIGYTLDGSDDVIQPDRSFDKYVSRHKKDLLSYIDQFIEANSKKGKSDFNGYGTYNMGFMIYGIPGCGKTSFIKALANKTKRGVVIVDMRKINTISQFNKVFKRWPIEHNVFVFEEFDCAPIHTRRDDETKTSSVKKSILDMRSKLMETLAVANDADSRKSIREELEKNTESLEELNDTLTIDAILTTLDGLNEHRNRIIVATTNHIERIDPALLREGRFDFKLHMTHFNNEEIKELLSNMYEGRLSEEDKFYLNMQRFPEKWTPVAIIHTCYVHRDIRKVISVLKEEKFEKML